MPVYAEVDDPKFFSFTGSTWTNRLVEMTFGWFKTLDKEQKHAYDQALSMAVLNVENGQRVQWYINNASGFAVPVATWPNGHGFCRRIHIQAIAYGVEKTMAATACFENADQRWSWYKE